MKSQQKGNINENFPFFIDSGASVHLANSLKLHTELKNSLTITFDNGTKLALKGEGKCAFNIETFIGQTNKVTLDHLLNVLN